MSDKLGSVERLKSPTRPLPNPAGRRSQFNSNTIQEISSDLNKFLEIPKEKEETRTRSFSVEVDEDNFDEKDELYEQPDVSLSNLVSEKMTMNRSLKDSFNKTIAGMEITAKKNWEESKVLTDEQIIYEMEDAYRKSKITLPKRKPSSAGSEEDSTKLWSSKLANSVDQIYEQMNQGSKVCGLFERFLTKYSDAHKRFSNELKTMFNEESAALDLIIFDIVPDSFQTLLVALRNAISEAHVLSVMHENHSNDISKTIVREVALFSKEYNERFESIGMFYEQINSKVAEAKSSLQKRHAASMKSLTADLPGGADHSSSSTPRVSIFDKAAAKFSKEQSKEKSFIACAEYAESIEETNRVLQKVVTLENPKVIDEMQDLEQFRHVILKRNLEKFGKHLKNIGGSYNKLAETHSSFTEKIELSKDLETTAKNFSHKNNASKYVVRYDLPVTIRELAKFASAESKKRFGYGQFPVISLNAVMAAQKERFPRLKIPITFIKLRSNISRLNGFRTEGIFRISPAVNELTEFVENVKEKNYEIFPSLDVHTVAAAFKQYLRAIEPPIIPTSFYDDLIKLGSSEEREPEEFNAFISKLHYDHQTLIHNLVHIVREVASPENFKTTKMDHSNLAVVFTPSLIRKKTDSTSDIVVKSNAEKNFVTNLFKKLKLDESMIQTEIRRRRGASKSRARAK